METRFRVLRARGVEVSGTGERWTLGPGDTYTVGPTDRHRLTIEEDTHLVCVFSPALTGDEAHDADGAYGTSGDPVTAGPGRMFVRTLEGLRGEGRERSVAGSDSRSIRILLKADDVGFTLCDVRLAPDSRHTFWYRNHWEANYILAGNGAVTDPGNGARFELAPGSMYVVGPEDRHTIEATDDLHLLSVFNPPLVGDETHDADGALPPSGPLPPGP